MSTCNEDYNVLYNGTVIRDKICRHNEELYQKSIVGKTDREVRQNRYNIYPIAHTLTAAQ